MKKTRLIGVILILLIVVTIAISFWGLKSHENEIRDNVVENSSNDEIVLDEPSLGPIDEPTPIDDFVLEENIAGAITQIALVYDSFDEDTLQEPDWKDVFVAKFIQNSTYSYAYLDNIGNNTGGMVSVSELEFIHESLTGEKLNFDNDVDATQATSSWNRGNISNYKVDSTTADEVNITADFELYSGSDTAKNYILKITLVKNPESCFDGYSIKTLSKTEKQANTSEVQSENGYFYGEIAGWQDDKICEVEFGYSEDNKSYNHFVYMDFSGNESLLANVKDMAEGSFVKVSYQSIQTNSNNEMVVVPIAVEMVE